MGVLQWNDSVDNGLNISKECNSRPLILFVHCVLSDVLVQIKGIVHVQVQTWYT